MQETQVWSLGQEDPLEEEMATHSSILAGKTPMDRGAWWAMVHGVTKSWTLLSDSTHTHTCHLETDAHITNHRHTHHHCHFGTYHLRPLPMVTFASGWDSQMDLQWLDLQMSLGASSPPEMRSPPLWRFQGSWRRQWHPTPVLLPGKSHGQRSLVGCSPWGR